MKNINIRQYENSLNSYSNDYTIKEIEELNAIYSEILPDKDEYSIIIGKVISISDKGAILDVGLKADGILPFSDLRGLSNLKIGDEIEVYLEKKEDKDGNIIISRKKASLVRVWEKIQKALDTKEVLQALVKRRTKGGLIVNIEGVEAFLPGSQIDVAPIIDFDKYIGNIIDVAIIKMKHSNNNVVVSHKVLIEKEIESQKISIINNLEKGQILEGTVKNITNFGLFIDLGGVDGLLHITDISWSKVTNPESMFVRGQKVKVVVTDFDEPKQRISLGMKQLTPHPWDTLSESIKEGSIIKGKVVNLTEYGAFLEIQKGVEGLIHVSEMSWSQYVTNPREYTKLGDELEAKVLFIDRDAKKMSLGIKQLTPIPWSNEVAGKKYLIGSKHKGVIRNITNFGIFVELEPGLEGLLHISDLSWTKKVNHPSELYKVGDHIEVQILTLDIDNKKLTLGIKQLEEDPWDAFADVFKISTIHKGTVIKKSTKGATIELPYGMEGYVIKKGLIKQNKEEAEVGDVLDFIVLEFSKEERKILLSHTETFETKSKKKEYNNSKKTQPRNLVSSNKSTLGDIEELSKLKRELSKKQKTIEEKNSDVKSTAIKESGSKEKKNSDVKSTAIKESGSKEEKNSDIKSTAIKEGGSKEKKNSDVKSTAIKEEGSKEEKNSDVKSTAIKESGSKEEKNSDIKSTAIKEEGSKEEKNSDVKNKSNEKVNKEK